MSCTEFGEIRFVEEERPVGMLLREDDNGVVLEEYLDETGENVDVVHRFDKDITLCEKEDFEYCLEEARKYEPDMTNPIFILKKSSSDEEDDADKQQRLENFKRVVSHNQMRPWQFFPN